MPRRSTTTASPHEHRYTISPDVDRVAMLGPAERNLKMLREALGVAIVARDKEVTITGDADVVAVVRRALDQLATIARVGQPLARSTVLTLIAQASRQLEHAAKVANPGADLSKAGCADWDSALDVYSDGWPVRPNSVNQAAYLDAIGDNDLVFGIGPAGTGKTYLAVAAAVHLLKTGAIKKVILVRPAVEAGEKLGYLPGDLEAKVNPYLRPLFDALHDMMDFATIKRFLMHDVVEVAPLAFMRGRTLNHAIVILDEAQNTTRPQMKMFLTRMGRGSRMVVTGDMTQTDLPDPSQSGLADAVHRLAGAPGVACVELTRQDIVRHDLVQRIVEAYSEQADAANGDPNVPITPTAPLESA